MKILKRLLRHLSTTTWAGRRYFPAHTLKAIQASIAAGENLHRAEVRLIVEPALTLSAVLNGVSARVRARELFAQYGIWDTEENCGVLIYINLADHKVEIIADRMVGRAVSAQEWQSVCQFMTHGFALGEFHDTAVAALVQLNALLGSKMPASGRRDNQLSDQPLIL